MHNQRVVGQIIDFNKTTFDAGITAMAMLQDQTEKMVNTSLEQAFFIPKEWRKMIDEWLESYKRGRDYFKKAMDENFRKIDFEDAGIKEIKKNITEVHKDINLMGSKLVALEKKDWSKDVVAALLKKKTLVAKEDLKPLKKTLSDIEKGMLNASDLGEIKTSVDQTEAKLSGMVEEIAKIKQVLQDLGAVLKSQSSASEKVDKTPQPVK